MTPNSRQIPLHNSVTARPQWRNFGGDLIKVPATRERGTGEEKGVAAGARAISRRKRTNQGINLLYRADELVGGSEGGERERCARERIYVCK